jgi:hypothetical protein
MPIDGAVGPDDEQAASPSGSRSSTAVDFRRRLIRVPVIIVVGLSV